MPDRIRGRRPPGVAMLMNRSSQPRPGRVRRAFGRHDQLCSSPRDSVGWLFVDQPQMIEIVAGDVMLGARRRPGDGGAPVLLVHGLSSNARLWDEVAAQLAAEGH